MIEIYLAIIFFILALILNFYEGEMIKWMN